jgi:3-oxoacyl-[acyl-carrier-protein] synthase-1
MLLTESKATPLPPHAWDGVADPALPQLMLSSKGDAPRRCQVVASNSFAFGGNNACLVLGRG